MTIFIGNYGTEVLDPTFNFISCTSEINICGSFPEISDTACMTSALQAELLDAILASDYSDERCPTPAPIASPTPFPVAPTPSSLAPPHLLHCRTCVQKRTLSRPFRSLKERRRHYILQPWISYFHRSTQMENIREACWHVRESVA